MKSERLTNHTKKQIAQTLVKNKYSWKRVALYAKSKLIANQAYETVFSASERLSFLSAPKHWFRKSPSISVYVGGEHHSLSFSGDSYRLRSANVWGDRPWSSDRGIFLPMPFTILNDKFASLSKIGLAVTELNEELITFRDDCDTDFALVMNALEKFNTSKQLEEGWPEVMKFYPIQKAEVKLPVVQIAILNVQLGLI